MKNVWWLVAAVCAVACDKGGGSSSGGAAGAGKERGACYGNHTCDQGLQCLSDLCVRPPPADCAKVAEKLASFRLGNYAPRTERDQAVADLTATCTSAMLSVDEGKCILDATTRYEVAACPRPLLPELAPDKTGCHEAAANFVKIFITEMATDPTAQAAADKVAAETVDIFEKSCTDDLWPDAAKKCVALATRMQDMDACRDTFGHDVEQRVKAHLGDALEKLSRAITQTIPPPQPPAVPAITIDAAAPATQPSDAGP